MVEAGHDQAGNIIISATKRFQEAFAGKRPALVVRRQSADARADEVEVGLGVKATGAAGNFAVGHVGAQANYTVKLKWKDKPEQSEE